jgi:flagellar biosynthesis/type III secretory pathway chaperone
MRGFRLGQFVAVVLIDVTLVAPHVRGQTPVAEPIGRPPQEVSKAPPAPLPLGTAGAGPRAANVIVELSPPEVVFQQAPAVPASDQKQPCQPPPPVKKTHLLKRFCCPPPAAPAAMGTVQTTTTVFPTTLTPLQIPSVAVGGGNGLSFQASGQATVESLAVNPAAHIAALAAYQEVEASAQLAAIEEHKRVLSARLSSLKNVRSQAIAAQAQAATPDKCCDDLAKQFKELAAQVQELTTNLGTLLQNHQKQNLANTRAMTDGFDSVGKMINDMDTRLKVMDARLKVVEKK